MSHHPLLTRIRAEFLEMPGLRLTREQAQRLFGVERALCQHLLDALVDARFLCITSNGMYGFATDGTGRRRPAKAELRPDQHAKQAS